MSWHNTGSSPDRRQCHNGCVEAHASNGFRGTIASSNNCGQHLSKPAFSSLGAHALKGGKIELGAHAIKGGKIEKRKYGIIMTDPMIDSIAIGNDELWRTMRL